MKPRIADGSNRTVFRSGNALVQVTLTNIAHVPDLRYHLFSLPTLVKNGHTFEVRPAGIVVKLKSERSIVFHLTGILFFSHTFTFQLLDKPWSQVSSLLPPGSCLQFLSRVGFSNPTARRFFFECC